MSKIRTIVIGTGGFALYALRMIAAEARTTRLIGLIEPAESQREATRALFERDLQQPCPDYYDSLEVLMAAVGKPDVAYITTPHKFHYPWIVACLQAGIDVLVEKPMVISRKEAIKVIALRDKTQRLVVVGFPGSLSPAMAKAKQMLARGEIGELQGISANVFQDWKRAQTGTWRQVPEISGGGFLFDTGSHLINTIVDLAGSDVSEVCARFDTRGTPVEINSTVNARFANGVLCSICAVGDSFDCVGEIRLIGTRGILEIGMWGHFLRARIEGKTQGTVDVRYGKPKNVWQNFVEVYRGKKPNPSPPEIGLRFAILMDAIRQSAATGRPVRVR